MGLTKQEINLRIAKLVFPELVWKCEELSGSAVARIDTYEDNEMSEPHSYIKIFNYNNWNDLMPLVDKYGIYYSKHNIGYSAACDLPYDDMIIREGDTLQLALAKCLLAVLEETLD